MIRRLFGPASSTPAKSAEQSATTVDTIEVPSESQQNDVKNNDASETYEMPATNVQRASGSLYEIIESTEGGVPEQKCVFLTCECFVRPSTARFTFELVIVRTDAEESNEENEQQPNDMIIIIDKSTGIENDSNQFMFYNRNEQKYSLDIDDEGACKQLRKSISLSLYQKLYSSLPITEEDKQEVEKILQKKFEPSEQDLLVSRGELLRASCELKKFDPDSSNESGDDFYTVLPVAIVTINSAVISNKNRVYVMAVYLPQTGDLVFEIEIDNSLNAQFFTESLKLIWFMPKSKDVDVAQALAEGDSSKVAAFSLHFSDEDAFIQFRNQFTLCVYEVTHNASIDDLKLKQDDINYIQNSNTFDDPMEIEENEQEQEIKEENEREDEGQEQEIPERSRRVQDARHRASLGEPGDGLENSHLAIATNHDRTFVVRGNKMGVFHTGDDGAQWKTTIEFSDPKLSKRGEPSAFTPSKVLLHRQDDSMLLLDPNDQTRIMRMDLNVGEIVDHWEGAVTKNIPIKTLQQTSKYSNMTDNQEFVGLNDNQLLRMDPRTTEFFVQNKKYAPGTRARLNCVATTGHGYLATASQNGDIRMFDQIGKNAKTHLPGLGDVIIGIDVTDNGGFILATTQKYLLLIDTNVSGQAKNGFEKSMGKNKPKPRKLTIRNDDIIKHKMGKIEFTTAHFNTGSSLERSIVTSTGPFIVVWNFRQVKMGKIDSYTIKKYQDTVVADNFPYNNDGRIVVTLPNDVSVAKR